MKLVAVLLIFVSIVAARNLYQTEFTEWMRLHNKAYQSSEFIQRHETFIQNSDFIKKFNNEGKHSYQVAMNEFGDLTNEEFKTMLGLKGFEATKNRNNAVVTQDIDIDTSALPTSWDWRTKGVVTPIKNQGQCGSCWSFSATGSTEGAHAIKTGNLVSLSEQNLMDCSTSYGNAGCDGGLMDYAFQYIIANNGIDTEISYPYLAEDGTTCNYTVANRGATLSGYKDLPSGNEAALQQASATIGPISVAMDASEISFQFYSSGVYWSYFCSSTELDHGVLVVGYGTDASYDVTDYWIVKNSWGTSWGLNGYFILARNDGNMCGVATAAPYPVA